jgi:peroxiredoxin
LGGFGEQYSELQNLNARIVAASTDNLENSTAIAADLPFPVAHGVTREQADTLGSWWEDRRGLIQPSDFILNHEGKILSATYSSGPIGRVEAEDAVRFIAFQEKLRKEAG